MQGRRDIPLSERGRAQVRAGGIPAEFGGSTAAWVSSPLRRAVGDGRDPLRHARRRGERADRDGLGRVGRPHPRRTPRPLRRRVARAARRGASISGRRAARARATCSSGCSPGCRRIAAESGPGGRRHASWRAACHPRRRHRLGHDRQAADSATERRAASVYRRRAWAGLRRRVQRVACRAREYRLARKRVGPGRD